jgi:hypothetical protein
MNHQVKPSESFHAAFNPCPFVSPSFLAHLERPGAQQAFAPAKTVGYRFADKGASLCKHP